MPLWSRGRNADRVAAERAEAAERGQREAAKRRILAEAARQRGERDQAVPPEHRVSETERRENAARRNQPTRWYERMASGQRHLTRRWS